MNSVTPISSLTSAINEMLIDESGLKRGIEGLDEDDMEDMYSSLQTIEERSKGLLKFVRDYKNVTRLPKPRFEDLDMKELMEHVQQLFKKDTDRLNISLDMVKPPPDLSICGDRQMIHQVLINLVKNSIEAVRGRRKKEIRISAYRQSNRTYIDVFDSGPGINPENAEQVFVPFFTTRKSGSGIGLSLSKQIMRLHKGRIYFRLSNKGTTFKLEF